MAVKKKQNERRYSLMIAPKEVIARELGKIRKKRKVSLEDAASYLHLTVLEVKCLEQGSLDSEYINSYLYNYMNFLEANFEGLYKKTEYKVSIPDIKTGKSLGTETYWMAIDAYTTRFSCREDLIKHIRNYHLAIISPDISDDDLWIFIDYPRESNKGIIDLVYSDNEELVKFIDENKIASAFSWSNPYVASFNEEIKQVFRSRPDSKGHCSAEYRIFARKHYYQFNPALALSLFNWDKEYAEDMAVGGAQRYSSIRANTLCHMAFKKEQRQLEKNLKPFNEIDDDREKEVGAASEPRRPFKYVHPNLEGKIKKRKIDRSKAIPGQMTFPLFDESHDDILQVKKTR